MSADAMHAGDAPLDIDRLMREIRAEIAARLPEDGSPFYAEPVGGSDNNALHAGSAALRLPRIGEFSQPLAKKARYRLDDFLAYHDADFTRNAYRALLGREPDAEGASRYIAKIRSGELSRIDVLGRIRFSPEGRAAGVRIDGLLVPFGMRTVRRFPVLGRLLGILQYIWRLPDLVRNHEILEAAVFANRSDTRLRVNAIVDNAEQALAHLWAAQSEQSARVDAASAQAAQFARRIDTLVRALALRAEQSVVDRSIGELRDAIDAAIQAANARIAGSAQAILAKEARDVDALRNASEALGQRLAHLGSAADLAALVASTARTAGDLRRISIALEGIHERLRSERTASSPQQEPLGVLLDETGTLVKRATDAVSRAMTGEDDPILSDGFYVAFEERFRGTRDDIKARVDVYLPLVRAAVAATADAPLLDIGCGRGEWLELLGDHDLVASGVDVNDVAVAGCRARGLDVVRADGIDYLRRLAPGSLGAVSALHVIEHLSFAQMVELFDEAHRVLRPGGIVILETPNPENLVVGACSFYSDPTHMRPLPPEPTRFTLESRGFERVQVMRLHPDLDVPDPGPVAGALAQIVNERFFGPRDYALIGFKQPVP